MPNTTITLSSVGTSPAANLNTVGGKPSIAVLTSSGTGASADVIVQATLDDLQRVASPLWFGLSSNPQVGGNLPAFHYQSSLIAVGGSSTTPECGYLPIPSPIAGLRLSSTAIAASNTLTLKVNQGDGW